MANHAANRKLLLLQLSVLQRCGRMAENEEEEDEKVVMMEEI